MSSPAEIAVERRGGSVVAHVSGEIDMTNAAYLREQLLDSMPNDALALVIDISGCRYLDSAAIEVLFDLSQAARAPPPGAAARDAAELAAQARDRADRGPDRRAGPRVAGLGPLAVTWAPHTAPAREGSRMAHESPKRIRNVALVGHRGSGKTSVNEALLFEAGAINRLGSVADGSTVSDSASDEKAREMSISASLSSFRWDDRKINLVDTPGEPSFIADALAALRVVEGAVFVVNGVMGVEVTTSRLWERASELGLARIVFVNMLDRERADFFRTLESLKQAFGQHVVATEIPIGEEHELQGVVDLIDMKAYRYDGDEPRELPGDRDPRGAARAGPGVPREADGRGGRGLGRAHGALPRGRGDLARGDRRPRSRRASPRGTCSPSPAAPPRATSASTACWTRSWRTCPRRRSAARSSSTA